jgi:hypothetical protein
MPENTSRPDSQVVLLDDTPPITVSSTFDQPSIDAALLNSNTMAPPSSAATLVVVTGIVVTGVVVVLVAATALDGDALPSVSTAPLELHDTTVIAPSASNAPH